MCMSLCSCVCVTDIDECKDSPCLNNASCVQGAGSFTCVCELGYTGVLCETGELCFSHSGGRKASSSRGNSFFLFLRQLSHLADVLVRRVSQFTFAKRSKLRLHLNSALSCAHTQCLRTTARKLIENSFTNLSPLVINC